MIVSARMRAEMQVSFTTGWYTERLARTKTLKDLDEYLKPMMLTPEQQREQGSSELRAMIQRMRQRQEAQNGTG